MAHITLSDEVRRALQSCSFTAHGTDHCTLVKMPPLERSVYEKTNKVLVNAGGKWQRGPQAHVFTGDVESVRIKLGLVLDTGRSIDIKKFYQAFYTPIEVAKRILAGVRYAGKRVLEPSAGGGAFADLLTLDAAELVCVELNPEAVAGLLAKGHYVLEGDFLDQSISTLGGGFDVIVMNPPFSADQDIRHVLHAYSLLNPGGELIAIVSPGYTFSANTKLKSNFPAWLELHDAEEEDLAAGAFDESGTPIRTRIISVRKPANAKPVSQPDFIPMSEDFIVPMPKQAPEREGWKDSGERDFDQRIIWVRGDERAIYFGHEDRMIPIEPDAKPQGQKLDGVDLQSVLDSATNAAQLGKQQFFTSAEHADALTVPLPAARRVFVDLTMGAGGLLAGSKAEHLLGCDIDRRCARQPSGTSGTWDCLTADLTHFYGLLEEVNWQYDLGGFNPPFSLKWDTARLAALAKSDVPAVRETFKPGKETIDSTLATLLLALDRQSPRGEGYLICNQDTAIKFLGDPRGDATSPLRRHVWLWLTVPPGMFEGVRDFDTAVLYFARGHSSSTPLHLTAANAEPETIAAALATGRHHRSVMRKGSQVWSADQSHPTTVPLWRAAAAEYRRLHPQFTGGPAKFNLWLEKGFIQRHLTPFQSFSGKIPKADIATLHDIQGKTPMSLVVQKPTRLAVLRAVRSEYWRVEPALLAAVEESCAQYAAERAPFYPLSETQRIGFLDEEDAIVCRQDFRWGMAFPKAGFTAGKTYPLSTTTRKIEHELTRPNILGTEESVTLHGQELVISLKDDSGMNWEFATFTEKDLKGATRGTLRCKLELLPEHFTIPEVKDVAMLHPEKYQANLTALRNLEAIRNGRGGDLAEPQTNPAQPGDSHTRTPEGSILSLCAVQPPMKGKTWAYRGYQIDDLARAAIHDGLVFAWDKGLGKTAALFSFALIKGSRRVLIVAPEALHEQIVKEGLTMFGVTVQPLGSQQDFYDDTDLQQADRELRNTGDSAVTGWWITSYTALGYNGADEWLGKENDDGDFVVSPKMKLNRRRDPLWRSEEDERGIGEKRGAITCAYRPSLATLVAELFCCVGVDEAVRLKSDDSYISLGVRRLRPKYRLVLTGTPIKNHLDDIFWLAHWASGGHAEPCARWPYGNSNSAREEFANTHMFIERNHTREEKAASVGKRRKIERRVPQICNVHRLWKLLAPAVLCRRKQDIGEALVPKTIIPIKVKPGSAQHAVYKFHCDHPPDFAKNGNPMNPIAQVVAQLQNLRQAALCPHTDNLSSTFIRLEKIREILKAEAARVPGKMPLPPPGGWDDATRKAILVAAKGESLSHMGPCYAAEAQVALDIVQRMISGSIPVNLDAIYAAAPNLTAQLKPAVVIESNKDTSRSWTDHNPKQAAILKLIEELISQGEQVVVMAPFSAFSKSLHARLVEAGVSCCLLDGSMSPAKRGVHASAFKRRKYAVLIGGQKSMGEGHSFECSAHLILPSLDWAFDTNSQCEDRVHRLNSPKPVSIYAMVTAGTIDERLQNLYEEKSDSASLALFAELSKIDTGEINLGKLLGEAIADFDPNAETIAELDIEKEWDATLKRKLRMAELRFREWHPPIVADEDGHRVTKAQVRLAVQLTGSDSPNATPVQHAPSVVAILKGLRDATYAALIDSKDAAVIAATRARFEAFCAAGNHTDWRAAWRAFDAAPKPKAAAPAAPAAPKSAARTFLDSLKGK